jgi:hypothetical protein
MKAFYVRWCRKYGPDGLTISAWAFKHSRDTGSVWVRNRIDGIFLLLAGQANHCQAQFQRESSAED